MPRKGAGKQQRLSKSTKRETHSPSRNSTKTQETPARPNSNPNPTKHVSRADAEEFQDLKRQLFKSPQRTDNKETTLNTENSSASITMLSSSLPHAMLSLAEVEEKLHNSVTTANSSSSSSSSIIVQPCSVETTSESQLIHPSTFAVPATTTTLPSSKSATKLVKAASLDVKLPHSFSQPFLVDGSTLQVPSHFPPVPPVMVSPGMRSAPVSSSSDQGLIMKPVSSTPAAVQTGSLFTKQQQPTTTSTTTEGKPLPPSSYQTPNRQTNVESATKESSLPKAQSVLQNGLLSPMVFQDNPSVRGTNKLPPPMLNKEQFMQAMLYMIQVSIFLCDFLCSIVVLFSE